jgi:hypothetical protein
MFPSKWEAMAETITLEFLAAQQRRTLDELAAIRVEMAGMRTEFVTMRDDITVLTAIVVRQENTTKAILDQLRTMTTQQNRFGDRLSALEDYVRQPS